MTVDETQKQTPSQISVAQDLSRPRVAPPCEIPGYDLERMLGKGAFGEVWVATALNTGRRVAVKIYHHHAPIEAGAIQSEVEKLVFLSADRYVVQLLEVGWHADPPYYVMEYLPNGSLEDRLQREGTLSIDDAVSIFRDVVVGMLHAHGKGIFHCDLKPANVLLDQDGNARIADFGQSRLSHDQRPALGTLFYMAPEQADLSASPDARWDVYAIGALLYTMLVGDPPFRNSTSIGEIDSTRSLQDRLTRYQHVLAQSSVPHEHKNLRGIDRHLVQIIDRSIDFNPKHRFQNVQEIVDALNLRERARNRRPLLILGVVAPMLLLLIGLLFGWQSYQTAMRTSEQAMVSKAHESNRFAAELAATNVANAIQTQFEEVEKLANDPTFVDLYRRAIENPEVDLLLNRLHRNRPTGSNQTTERIYFRIHPLRQALQDRLTRQFQLPSQSQTASWFVTDELGFHIAAAFDVPPAVSPVGGYYGYRSYFHGQSEDLPVTAAPPEPVSQTSISAVFLSTASGTWKVAISTPIKHSGEIIGVLAMSIDVGRFTSIEPAEHQFAVLVDGRDTSNKGVILQHPFFDDILKNQEAIPKRFSEETKYRVDLDRLEGEEPVIDIDPIGRDPDGYLYRKPWIFAAKRVSLQTESSGGSAKPSEVSTDLVVVVQEDHEFAVHPIRGLGSQLVYQALAASAMIVVVIAGMWAFAARVYQQSGGRSGIGSDTESSQPPIHHLTTIVPGSPQSTEPSSGPDL